MIESKQSTRKACMTCGEEYADAPDKCPFDGTALSPIGIELAPGAVLDGRYEIISAVASGGMGQIYKAKHQLMNRVVAIKTLHMSLMSGAALQRFQQEAQAISALNHPNILSVFDFFISDDGQPYLVMDYLQGTNLREVLKAEKRIELSRALPILIEACCGFAHAHAHGVIHRDIKPANLMLVNSSDTPDFVKIVDFGIAKVVSEAGDSKHLTATGDTFGSPEFMSPEQCRAKIPDARSDIYSLGCVMYVMLTGCSPFTSQDPMEIMYKQVHDSPPPLSKACPEANLSEAVDAVVLKAIQKEPENRFQSMNEMRLALQSIGAQPNAPVTQQAASNTVIASSAETLSDTALSKSATSSSAIEAPTISATKSVAIKNQSMAASAAIGVAVVAVILIAVGIIKQDKSAPITSTVKQTQPQGGTMQTANVQTAVPAAVAPQPVVDSSENTQVQKLKQADSSFQSNFNSGETEFRAHHFPEARAYFASAHAAAGTFGQNDTRYIKSLYWISKCDLSSGNFRQALDGLQFVAYAQRKLYGPKSSEVRTTESDLQSAKRAIKR